MRRRRRRRRSGVLGNGKGSLDILCGGMNSVAPVEYFPRQNEVTKQSIFKCGERIGLRLWSLDFGHTHELHERSRNPFFFF